MTCFSQQLLTFGIVDSMNHDSLAHYIPTDDHLLDSRFKISASLNT